MSQSSFGNKFKVTTWGESHGKALGAVIDGCPAGLPLCEEDIQKFLDRRKPGQSRYTTARKEGDLVEILSGVFEGKTTGTPISLMVRNTDQRSRDYGNIAYSYRPGHADYTFDQKYGFRDYRGENLAFQSAPIPDLSDLLKLLLLIKKKSIRMHFICRTHRQQ